MEKLSRGIRSGEVGENGMRQADEAGHGWILLGSVRNLLLYLQSIGKLSQAFGWGDNVGRVDFGIINWAAVWRVDGGGRSELRRSAGADVQVRENDHQRWWQGGQR